MKQRILTTMIAIAAILIVGAINAQDNPRVVILDFNAGAGVNQDAVASTTTILTSFLREDFEVLDLETEVHRIVNEQGFQLSTLTEEQMEIVDSMLNIAKIVTGEINIVRRQYMISATVINAQTSEPEGVVAETGAVFHQVAQRLARSLVVEMQQAAPALIADGEQITAERLLEGGDDGVLINGVRWATRNVNTPGTFVHSPEIAGQFYHWGSQVSWVSLRRTTGLITVWERNNPCPRGWRVPTNAEFQSLVEAGSVWTTVNEVNGRLFGTAPNQIFLPAAGGGGIDQTMEHIPTHVSQENVIGFYWSNMRTGSSGWRLRFTFGDVSFGLDPDPRNLSFGYNVRCVAVN